MSVKSNHSECPFSIKSQKCVMIGGAINAVIVLFAYCAYLYFQTTSTEVVYTKLGGVRGTIGWSRNGNEFSQFLGIPFAQPPIGPKLRFSPPEPAFPWEGVRDASYLRPLCLQVESFATGFILGQEDCLYLNIFVPKIGKTSQKTVMVYIHGGLFHVGGSNFAGPKYFMDEDVILITLNYRLGVFGFLSTGDEVISGNMGLKDQNMALKWIKENIHAFGGDPNKIVIFGESAGGASVHHHILSPASQGLFYKAIHQSGSSINYWAVYRNVWEQAQRLAEKFSCPTSSSQEIASCLRKLDSNTIVKAHRDLFNFYRPQISTFVPTIEAANSKSPFITEEPRKLLEAGKFQRIPILTGVNSNEGQLISKTIIVNQTKLNEANDNWNVWAPRTLHYPESLTDVSKKLYNFYFGGVPKINDAKFHKNYTNIFGDRLFIVRGAVAGRLESKFTPTYMYYYDYSSSFNTGELLANAQGDFLPHWLSLGYYVAKQWVLQFFNLMPKRTDNACHSDEIAMLFNRDFLHSISPSHPDYQMSADLVKLWTSFANDEPILRFRGVEWKPNFETKEIRYLRINENPSVIEEPFETRRIFWESLGLPNL
ncbi:unnamed protein product [Orchesella dallaii]|uniref:Carboxylic ester hydrolase n=1 Tax=Orchesella dallaii TaxID=48710 RepID=A0ABP1Q5Q7_9HEXA